MSSCGKKGLTIKCEVFNSWCNEEFEVTVYDSKNNLIYYDSTTKGNSFVFYPNCKDRYKINVTASKNVHPGSITRWYNLDPCTTGTVFFSFINSCIQDRPEPTDLDDIYLNLTDANYEGLPISKGEIQLWPTT